jgi:hypothetical protein
VAGTKVGVPEAVDVFDTRLPQVINVGFFKRKKDG